MKNNIKILCIVLLLTLTHQQTVKTKELLETATNTNGNPFRVQVPDAELGSTHEYGFAMWIKASYLTPSLFNFNTFHENHLGIAGISEEASGDYCGEQIGDKALTLQLLQAGYSQNPSYLIASYSIAQRSNGMEMLQFPTRQDFDNQWNFVYMAYSLDQQQSFAYFYWSHSGIVTSHIWDNNIKRNPAGHLAFRAGGCGPSSRATFQGKYSNVNFFYGHAGSGLYFNSEVLVDNFRNAHECTASAIVLATEATVVSVVGPVSRPTGKTPIQQQFDELHGENEYAVWGWAKWNQEAALENRVQLFRLTSNKNGEFSDDSNLGDRTLSCFVEDGEMIFSTYTFDYANLAGAADFSQRIQHQNMINQWFFVYFGYSESLNEAYAYVKFQNMQGELTWGNVYHMRPDSLILQIAGDDFHSNWQGQVQDWSFSYGPGSYRTGQLEQIYGTFVEYEENLIQNSNSAETVEISTEEKNELIYEANYETSFHAQQPIYHYQVPDEQLSEVEDSSISFWVKWSFQYPSEAKISEMKSDFISVAHISETDLAGTNFGDRKLSVFMRPLSFGQKQFFMSTYLLSKGRPNVGQNFKIAEDTDFDGAWAFMYLGHSKQRSEAFGYMRFASGAVVHKIFANADHNYPPQGLFFRLGKAEGFEHSFNGLFYGAEFKFQGQHYLGTAPEVEAFYSRRPTPAIGLIPLHDEVIVTDEVQFSGDSNVEGYVFSTTESCNANQYSVYGWAKWNTFANKQTRHALFRLTTNQENSLGDNDKAGDRDLMFTVADGSLKAYTYSYNLFGDDTDQIEQEIPYLDDLESWFWIYFGYNRQLERAYVFIRFYDRIQQLQFDGIKHYVASRFRLSVGTDRYTNGFNGEMKDWHLSWGVGAYREQDFQELYGQYEPTDQPQLDLDNTWTEPSTLLNSQYDQDGPVRTELDADTLANVNSYSFSFWARFSFNDPHKMSIKESRNSWTAVAGVSETDGYFQNDVGSRALALYLRPLGKTNQPTLFFSTYATNKGSTDEFQDMTFQEEDLDSVWNWVYFGYDMELQRAFTGVFFSESQTTKNLVWEQIAHQRPSRLNFQLGRAAGDTAINFNGNFFDVRFRTDALAYKEFVNTQNYFVSSISLPPLFKVSYSQESLVEGTVDSTLERQAEESSHAFPDQYRGAKQYAIYGWAKWSQIENREIQHSLFRMTTNTPSVAGNFEHSGDRTLAVFITRNTLEFSTYTFGLNGGDNWDLKKTIDLDDDLTSWFFVYMGYSRIQKKIKVFVKFQDREEILEFEDINHTVPKYVETFVGKDRFYPAFNGQLKNWVFSAGQNSFQESGYEVLYNDVDESDNKYYEQSTQLSTDGAVLYEEEVSVGKLQTMKSVSTWTWFSWGFNFPNYLGEISSVNGNSYHISRIIFASGKGVYSNLVFAEDGSASIQFIETSGEEEQTISVPVPTLDDLDNSWNFVYMSHDEESQTTTVYVYFKYTDQRWIHTFESRQWNFPSEQIRFKLGGSARGSKVFNGRFFDGQLSTFQKYTASTVETIAVVQTQVTVSPEQYDDHEVDELQKTDYSQQNDGLVEISDSTVITKKTFSEYSSMKQFSSFGWSRWTGEDVDSETQSILVFKINQFDDEHAQDDSQPGDRTLGIWLVRRGSTFVFKFYTYSFEGTTVDFNREFETTTSVQSIKDQWFFSYVGYSREFKKSFFFMRFADGSEIEKVFENIRFINSKSYNMFLGKDQFSSSFKGSFYSFQWGVGSKSFVSTSIEARQYQKYAKTTTFKWSYFDNEKLDGEDTDVEHPEEENTEILDENEGYDNDQEEKDRKEREEKERLERISKKTNFEWNTASRRVEVNKNRFINKYKGYSYFYNRGSVNREFKITFQKKIVPGTSVCFGYIPESLLDKLEQIDGEVARYKDDAIAVCTNNDQVNCFGSGECANGQLDLSEGATYLWQIFEDTVVLKKQFIEKGSNCNLLDSTTVLGDPYFYGEDEQGNQQCMQDELVTEFYEVQPIPAQYSCTFSKQRKCAEEGVRENLVPYIELKGETEVSLGMDELGDWDVSDNTQQGACNNQTTVTPTVIDSSICGGTYSPPPVPPSIETPVESIPTPKPHIVQPRTCNGFETFNGDKVIQAWITVQPEDEKDGLEGETLANTVRTLPVEEFTPPRLNQGGSPPPLPGRPGPPGRPGQPGQSLPQPPAQPKPPKEPVPLTPGTHYSPSPVNINGNYKVTCGALGCEQNCFGYKQSTGEFLGACITGEVHGTEDPNSFCKGTYTPGSPVSVTVQATTIQITSEDHLFQCNIERLPNILLNPMVITANECKAIIYGQGGIDCPKKFVEATIYECDPDNLLQAWDYEIQAAQSGVERYGVVDSMSLQNDHPDLSKQFFSPQQNHFASFTVTLTQYASEAGKWVCFGYIDASIENALREDPDAPIYTETISVCTDGTKYNNFDDSTECSGLMNDVEGAQFALDVQDSTLTVRQVTGDPDSFKCIFNRDKALQYIPWIEIRGEYTVEAPFTGCCDCIHHDTHRTCEHDWADESQLQGNAWFNAFNFDESTDGSLSSLGQWNNELNKNGNYIITLPEDSENSICFGYITSDDWDQEVVGNRLMTFVPENHGFCNEPAIVMNPHCQGTFHNQKVWTVTVQLDSTQFTSEDNFFQCNFPRDGDQTPLEPWVYSSKTQTINVLFTGVGGIDCPVNIGSPSTPTIPTPIILECQDKQTWQHIGVSITTDGEGTFTSSSEELTSEIFETANPGETAYTVEVLEHDTKVCFGWATPYVHDKVQAADPETLLTKIGLFSYGHGVCTDGTAYNYDLELPTCVGSLQIDYTGKYYVYYKDNVGIIRDQDASFQCDFPISQEVIDTAKPWVHLTGKSSVVIDQTCVPPVAPPPPSFSTPSAPSTPSIETPEPKKCSQHWVSSKDPQEYEYFVNHEEDGETMIPIQSNYGITSYWSPINENMEYAVTFRHNSPNGNSCFGFIPKVYLEDGELDMTKDVSQYTVSACTDGTTHNVFKLQEVCRGDLNTVRNQEIYLWFENSYIRVRSRDDLFECSFRTEDEDLVPWIQQVDEQSILAKVTCQAPGQCKHDCSAWNNTGLVDQSWEKFQISGFSQANFLKNEDDTGTTVSFYSSINENANFRVTLNQDFDSVEPMCFGFINPDLLNSIRQDPTQDYSEYSIGLCSNNQSFNHHFQHNNVTCEGLEETSFDHSFGSTYRVIIRETEVQIFLVSGPKGNFRCVFERNPDINLVPWIQLPAHHSVAAHFDGIGGSDCEDAPHFCGYVPPPPPPPKKPECAYVYSQCSYQGVSFEICGKADGEEAELPQTCQGAVLSIWLPPGAEVNLGCLQSGKVDCGGDSSVAFNHSQDCLGPDSRLDSPQVQMVQKQLPQMTKVTNNFQDMKDAIEKNRKTALVQVEDNEDCVTLYSECHFEGKQEKICSAQPNLLIEAKSMKIPHGWTVSLYKDADFSHKYGMYSYNIECLKNSKSLYYQFQNREKEQTFFIQRKQKTFKHLQKNRRY